MANELKARIGALIAAAVVNLLGVVFFFRPIAEQDRPGAPLLPAPLAFLVYVVLCVALFDWLARGLRSPAKAAFAVAACQYALVVDLTLRGERGVMTAAASAVLLAVTWVPVAWIYGRMRGPDG